MVLMQTDRTLLLLGLALISFGLIMVGSASIYVAANEFGQPFHYFLRQTIFAVTGIGLASAVVSIRLSFWQRYAPVLLMLGIALLVLVLIPGMGRKINGSSRWIALGPVNIQVAEIIKLVVIVYIADYLQRNQGQLTRTFRKVFGPLILVGLSSLLLLMQPDMGSVVVILSTVLAMLFLGGARLDVFAALISIVAILFIGLIKFEPYRMARLQSFMDPWADPFGSGFQLTQALIAFGRGDWFGAGLGNSLQKLAYLPEAHTDFIYSIVAEELGLLGAMTLMLLFFLFIWRAFQIGRVAEVAGKIFAAQIAYGVAIWMGLQAGVNMGVNMGMLPTKGLTLPFISYGGSSLVITCIAVALVLRVDLETRYPQKAAARVRR